MPPSPSTVMGRICAETVDVVCQNVDTAVCRTCPLVYGSTVPSDVAMPCWYRRAGALERVFYQIWIWRLYV
jgi:hypothetical protein